MIEETNYPKEELTINFIKYAIFKLNNIILNSPKPKQPFVVYQYSSHNYLPRTDDNWENIGFYSTTMVNDYTIGVVENPHYKTCIIVPIDTPCLIITSISKFPTEYEVLFPSNNCFKVLKPYTQYSCEEIKQDCLHSQAKNR